MYTDNIPKHNNADFINKAFVNPQSLFTDSVN